MGPKYPTLPSKPRTEGLGTPRCLTVQEIHALATRQEACHPPARVTPGWKGPATRPVTGPSSEQPYNDAKHSTQLP